MLAGRLNVTTRQFRVEDVPEPKPGPSQLLIKVEAAGVCLSDLHLIDGTLSPLHLSGDTVTLGHETAGTVAEVGPDCRKRWAIGDRVLLAAVEPGGGAVLTRGVDYDGGWAEYAVATESTVLPIPDDLPMEQAAIIPDAVSTPWGAVAGTAAVRAAQAVGVWGVGGLGAHGIQLLRMVGAAPIFAIDPLPSARPRALDFGADVAIDASDPNVAEEVRRICPAGLAVAFDFAGVAAVREQAVGCLAAGGKLVLVGLTDKPLTINDGTRFSYLQQQILGHYASRPEHLEQLVELTRRHRLDFSRSISGVFPLSEAAEAVRRLENKEGDPIRLILRPLAGIDHGEARRLRGAAERGGWARM